PRSGRLTSAWRLFASVRGGARRTRRSITPSASAASRSAATRSRQARSWPRSTHAPRRQRSRRAGRCSLRTGSRAARRTRGRSSWKRSPEMPELPEVETIRLALEPHLVGRRLERVEISDRRLVRPFEPVAVAAELEGERIDAVQRRGKYLIVRFESGRALLIHLRMTGSLRHAGMQGLPGDPHRRAVVRLDDGSDVAYRDVRRFGTWHLLEPD